MSRFYIGLQTVQTATDSSDAIKRLVTQLYKDIVENDNQEATSKVNWNVFSLANGVEQGVS